MRRNGNYLVYYHADGNTRRVVWTFQKINADCMRDLVCHSGNVL